MPVTYDIPGRGWSRFNDGTSYDDALKIAGTSPSADTSDTSSDTSTSSGTPVVWDIPGRGWSRFAPGTSYNDALKIAGVPTPEPDKSKSSSIYRGAGQLVQGVGSAMKDVWPETGEAVEQYGKGVVEANPASYPNLSDIHGIGSALSYAKERVLEGVPLVAGGVAAGLAGGELAAGGLMATAMGTQTYGDVREKQRVNGEDNIPAAVGAGVLAGGLGVAGGAGGAIRGAFGKAAADTASYSLLGVPKTILGSEIAGSAAGSAAEQAVINPVIAGASRAASGESVADSDALGDYVNQAVSGAVVGGAFGAAARAGAKGYNLLNSPKPVETPAETPEILALPHPDQFTKPALDEPLYGDSQGNVSPSIPDQTAPVQPASVAPGHDPLELLQRLHAAGGESESIAPFTLEVASKLDPLLSDGNTYDAHLALDHFEKVANQTPPKRALDQARKEVDDPTDQMKVLAKAREIAGYQTNPMGVVAEARKIVDEHDSRQRAAAAAQTRQDILASPLSAQRQAELEAVRQKQNADILDAYQKQKAQADAAAAAAAADQQRQANIATYRKQKAQADAAAKQRTIFDMQLEQANQKIVDSHRNAIVQRALNDPNETNHAARVADVLKRNGLDPELLPHEQAAVDLAQERQRQSADAIVNDRRQGIMQHVLSDPDETNHTARISELLQRNGLDPELRPHEQENAERVEQYRRERAPDNSNLEPLDTTVPERWRETDNSSMESRIPERRADNPTTEPQIPERAPRESNTSRGRYAPENFRMETQSEDAFRRLDDARKRRDARNARPEPTPTHDERQGELFGKTETRGDKIKREVAERNAATRERVIARNKDELNGSEARQETRGDQTGIGPREVRNETGRPEKTSRGGDRGQGQVETEGHVTYESVLQEAERHLASDGQSGLLKPKEYQQLSVLAEQRNISPEKLQDMLNRALDRASQKVIDDAHTERSRRQDPSLTRGADERRQYSTRDAQDAYVVLRDRLDKLGLHDVGLGVINDLLSIDGKRAVGGFSELRKVIGVAMGDLHTMSETLDHEAVHALKYFKLIKPEEWNQVIKELRRNRDFAAMIDRAYDDLPLADRNEELFSEAFARWASDGESVLKANGIFNRIKAFLDTIRQFFVGKDLHSAKEIFNAIESGEIGRRARPGGAELAARWKEELTRPRKERLEERNAGEHPGSPVSPQLAKARLESLEKRLPEVAREPVHHVFDTLADWYRYGKAGMAFTQDLANMAGKMMPAAKEYVRAMEIKAREHRVWDGHFEKAIAKFHGLDASLRGVGDKTVNGMIQAIDEAKAWPYDPEHLSKRADNPITNYPKADAKLQAKWDVLDKNAQALVKDVFRTNHEMLTATKEVVKAVSGEKGLDEFKTLVGLDESQPYNSRRRHGDYSVFAKSAELKAAEEHARLTVDPKDAERVNELRAQEEHYFVQQYDTFAQAQKVVRALRSAKNDSGAPLYHDVLDARPTDKGGDQIVGAKSMMLAFARLKNHIRDQVPDADPKVLDGITKLANDLYIRSLKQSSSRKGELRRLGVAGGDMDSMQNFVIQGRAQAHFIASMKHSDTIFEKLAEMRQQARKHPEPMAQQIANEMMLRHASSLTYNPNVLTNAIKSMAGNWMIVTNPGFFLQQLAQPLMLSTPYLAGRHGDYLAGRKMLANMASLVQLRWKHGSEMGTLPVDKIKDAGVKDAIRQLSERGLIDVGLNQELGNFTSLSGNRVLTGASKVMSALKHATCQIEAYNRVVSGMTAYQLESAKLLRENKLTPEQAHQAAVDYAYKVVYDTHGDYSGFNAPRPFRTTVGSVSLQFRKYQLVQTSLLIKLSQGFLKEAGESPERALERAALRRALGYTLLHAGVAGGLMGLPGAATAAWIVNNVLTDPNEPRDIEQQIREGLGDPALANILLKGLPTLGTHGLDLSDKLAMGGAFSLLPYVEEKPSARDTYTNLLAALPGPALGSVGMNMADAYDQFHRWNYYRGFEKLMPKGLANAMKAYREATEGVTTAKAGDTLMKPEDVSFAQTLFTGLGLKTADVSERSEKTSWEIDKAEVFKDRSSRITAAFDRARKAGDSEGMADARRQFKALQQAKFEAGYKRSPLSSLMQSANQQRIRERNTVNGVSYGKGSPALREAREEAAQENE